MSEVRREALARVYFEWAVDPSAAANAHAFLFGTTPVPVSMDQVRTDLGDAAADAWLKLRKSKAAFFAAVRAKEESQA